jgi:DMSO reductase anchor subunit
MIRRRLAIALVSACARILPPRQGEWARAMQAELAAIDPPNTALAFAFGCCWASSKQRMLDMDQRFTTIRFALIAAMGGLALLLALFAARFGEVHAPTGVVFACSAAACAAAALWSLRRGWQGPVEASAAMLLLYILAFIALRIPLGQSEWANILLYRALTIEGVFIWGLLLAGAVALSRVSARRA